MSPIDISQTCNLVNSLWPLNRWPHPLAERFIELLRPMPIDGEQARAALLQVRADNEGQTIDAAVVLKRLKAITGGGPTKPVNTAPPVAGGIYGGTAVSRARQLCRLPHAPLRAVVAAYLPLLVLTRGEQFGNAVQQCLRLFETEQGTDAMAAVESSVSDNPELEKIAQDHRATVAAGATAYLERMALLGYGLKK